MSKTLSTATLSCSMGIGKETLSVLGDSRWSLSTTFLLTPVDEVELFVTS